MERALPRDTRGFGLIELMVTLLTMGILMLGLFTAFFRSNDEAARMSKLVEFRQSARASVQLIERDVRMAGSGWGRRPVQISATNDSIWYAMTAGTSTGPNDSLTLFGAWSSQDTLMNDMTLASSAINVTTPTLFATGNLIVVSDINGNSWHMFHVTGIAGNTLQHANSSDYNTVTRNWPSGGYRHGSFVYKVSRLTYRVDSLSFNRPCLVRQEFGGQPQVVAYDLNRFQVWYRMQDSSLTRDPMGWGSSHGYGNGRDYIAQVQPRICVRVTGRNRPTLLDSVWAEVRPRTF
jgi:type II secretory pathway pseudopilin PulG